MDLNKTQDLFRPVCRSRNIGAAETETRAVNGGSHADAGRILILQHALIKGTRYRATAKPGWP